VLCSATLDAQYLEQAQAATEWTLKNRALPNGGFRHDEKAAAGPYLEESLAMGRGLLALYSVTGDRHWLARAEDAARFVAFVCTGGTCSLPQFDGKEMLALAARLEAPPQ
jgi:uncharacterized protein